MPEGFMLRGKRTNLRHCGSDETDPERKSRPVGSSMQIRRFRRRPAAMPKEFVEPQSVAIRTEADAPRRTETASATLRAVPAGASSPMGGHRSPSRGNYSAHAAKVADGRC